MYRQTIGSVLLTARVFVKDMIIPQERNFSALGIFSCFILFIINAIKFYIMTA